jgi:toxin HigB-1
MIVSFRNSGTEDLFHGRSTKAARKVCPETIWSVARRKLQYVNAATRLADLRMPPNNRLEALKLDRVGQHSIRINDRYRVCFRWSTEGAEEVEVVDYH